MKFEEILKKEIIEKVGAALPELYEARDKVAAQQEALEGRISQLKTSRAKLEGQIEDLRAEGSELAARFHGFGLARQSSRPMPRPDFLNGAVKMGRRGAWGFSSWPPGF